MTKVFKLKKTNTNLTKLQTIKDEYKNMIETSKLEEQKNIAKFLNESRDENQFWHRYNKILGRKDINIVEPIFDNTANQYIFDDSVISDKLADYHINKHSNNTYNELFKTKIESELNQILNKTQVDIENVFFTDADIKHAIKSANQNAAPGPDRLTLNIIEHGGNLLVKSLTLLMQSSYYIGYFRKLRKRENRIYIKKPDKETYHQ